MATGWLEVRGTVAIDQFWPVGRSDGDTVQVELGLAADSFRFRANAEEELRSTRVFDEARVRGAYGPSYVLKKTSAKTRQLSVRLQGIDAPELHYRASPARKLSAEEKKRFDRFGHEYRQRGAETGALLLRAKLETAGAKSVPCRVVTAIDAPGDACDIFGRLVGDLLVELPDGELHVNRWLVRQGLAVPTFYNSMSEEEIDALLDDLADARRYRRGLFAKRRFTRDAVAFRFGDTYRKGSAEAKAWADDGECCLPKLFRRKTHHAVNRKHRLTKVTFDRWLADHRDDVHLLDDYREQGATAAKTRHLHEFVKASRFTLDPVTLVFRESASRLVDAAGNTIKSW